MDAITKIEWTFSGVLGAIRRLSAALQVTHGLTKGQVVALALPNCAEFLVSLLAVAECGGILALVNPGFTAGLIDFYCSLKRPIWIENQIQQAN